MSDRCEAARSGGVRTLVSLMVEDSLSNKKGMTCWASSDDAAKHALAWSTRTRNVSKAIKQRRVQRVGNPYRRLWTSASFVMP